MGQETPGSSLALQKRHAQAHQVVEGIPMHHVLAAIDDVEVDLWLLFFQQLGAFTGVGAVFATEDYHCPCVGTLRSNWTNSLCGLFFESFRGSVQRAIDCHRIFVTGYGKFRAH